MQAYEPREHRFHGVRQHGDWRLRLHSIAYGSHELDWGAFDPGLALALEALPEPAVAAGRPGVGFVILHQGRTGNYTVLAWWDNENELPLRIFVSPAGRTGPWRPNASTESICVWDLEVLAAERDAYVRCLLTPQGGGREAYLQAGAPGSSSSGV